MPPPQNHDHSLRISLLEKSLEGVEKQLNDINGNLNKLVWAIILALLMAVVQFALKGGFNV